MSPAPASTCSTRSSRLIDGRFVANIPLDVTGDDRRSPLQFGRPDSHDARGFWIQRSAVDGSQTGAAFQVADDDGGDVDAVDLT